jgi:hypothetical protein
VGDVSDTVGGTFGVGPVSETLSRVAKPRTVLLCDVTGMPTNTAVPIGIESVPISVHVEPLADA